MVQAWDSLYSHSLNTQAVWGIIKNGLTSEALHQWWQRHLIMWCCVKVPFDSVNGEGWAPLKQMLVPLGATPRPWLVRYPKENLCLLFTHLTGGKCKYKVSHVFSCHEAGQCWPETVQGCRKRGYWQKVQSVCPVDAHRCSTMKWEK